MKTLIRTLGLWGVALLAGTAHAAVRHGHVTVAGVVNINAATTAQLDLLPGVGAKAAQSIVDYRSKHAFTRPEEVVNVKGFGKKRFEKLKGYLSIQGATTLHRTGGSTPSSSASHTRTPRRKGQVKRLARTK